MRTCCCISPVIAVLLCFAGSDALAKNSRNLPRHHLMTKSGHVKMTNSLLQTCDVKSAKINLVNEDVLTWTAITVDTVDRYSKPINLSSGDARLTKLNTLLHGLELKPAVLPQLEMRMMLQLTCVDGTVRLITGSKTDDDGHMHLSIDGKMALTTSPLRKGIEALVN
jgi:hypothetical protein